MSFAKWIGGSIGWSIGGPIGAIAGFALGALLDNSFSDPKEKQRVYEDAQQNQQTKPGDFGMSLVILSAAVMNADNKIMKSELDFVKSYLIQQFGAAHAQELIMALKEVVKTQVPIRQVCLQIRSHMSHPMRLQLIHYLFGVGFADGVLSRIELNTLNAVARYMGISQKDFYSIHAMFGGQQSQGDGTRFSSSSLGIDQSYQILEIDNRVNDGDVKKAYRKMAKKYHPDKVAALGPEFQKAAKEKFQKVQQAYEEVKKRRGIS